MNCHGEDKGKKGNHKHSPLKHMMHMILCCGLPIVIIGLLPFIARISPSAGSALSKITPFICPIMMVSMMMMMSGNKKGSCCGDEKHSNSNKSLELKNTIE